MWTSGGRVKNVFGTHRVYLPHDDVPGLAMSRSLGDFAAHTAGENEKKNNETNDKENGTENNKENERENVKDNNGYDNRECELDDREWELDLQWYSRQTDRQKEKEKDKYWCIKFLFFIFI